MASTGPTIPLPPDRPLEHLDPPPGRALRRRLRREAIRSGFVGVLFFFGTLLNLAALVMTASQLLNVGTLFRGDPAAAMPMHLAAIVLFVVGGAFLALAWLIDNA